MIFANHTGTPAPTGPVQTPKTDPDWQQDDITAWRQWRQAHPPTTPAPPPVNTPAPTPPPGTAPGNPGPTPPPQQPGVPTAPAPAPPLQTIPPFPGTWNPGTPGGPPSGASGGMYYGDYNDPYNAVLASIPGMQQNMTQNISNAMAQAGFGGNRYSSSAENQAGQIGAQTAMQENQMLNQAMYNQANQDQNRALQAAGQGANMGMDLNSIQQQQLTVPFNMAQAEQALQQGNATNAYQQWLQNSLGFLPMLMQGAMSQGSGTPGYPTTTTTASTPGAANYLPILASLFG
jgi:hypothetical protein